MASKLTRNFATQEELQKLGVLDAELFDTTVTSLPATTPFNVDGESLADGDRVLFSNLTTDNNRRYQASISGINITWTPLDSDDLTEDQKVLIDRGSTYENDFVQIQSGTWKIANQGAAGGAGEANTASNIGTGVGRYGLFANKVGVDLQFKSLEFDGPLSVLGVGIDHLAITSSAQNNTASNFGGGIGIFRDKNVADLRFKTLVAGTNITINDDGNTLEIVAAGGASGEVNTGSSVGGASEVFKQKVGVDLQFRTLAAGSNVSIVQNADTLEISANDTGEVNTASNLGAGEGIFTTKSGVDLPFKSLVAGSNVSLSSDANTVTINATDTGEANTASNLGAGEGIFTTKSGVDLPFKSLVAGANVSLSSDANTVTINATDTGEANTASNLGAGEGISTTKSGVDLPFKSLVAGTDISLSSDANTITINSTAGGGGIAAPRREYFSASTSILVNPSSNGTLFNVTLNKTAVDSYFKLTILPASVNHADVGIAIRKTSLGFAEATMDLRTGSTSGTIFYEENIQLSDETSTTSNVYIACFQQIFNSGSGIGSYPVRMILTADARTQFSWNVLILIEEVFY